MGDGSTAYATSVQGNTLIMTMMIEDRCAEFIDMWRVVTRG